MRFTEKLEKAIKKNNSLLCVGLDPDIKKLPKHLLKTKDPLFFFNKEIIDSTCDFVCAYKPNIAFYEAEGIDGLLQLKKTIEYLKLNYPQIPTILDAKRGDIGNTSAMYAKEIFDYFGFDSLTVNPYLGKDAVDPFLSYGNKGTIILCRTSNKGAADFQDLILKDNTMLYEKIAEKIIEWDNSYHNCLMVVGATWPEELKKIRKIAKDMFFLVPGIGSQNGNLELTLKNGLREDHSGLIISSSRSIIYSSQNLDFASKARNKTKETRDLINKYR